MTIKTPAETRAKQNGCRQPLKLSDASIGRGVALWLLRAIAQLALDEPVDLP